ncbi:hypothetical protein CKM354_000169900 [Cercospora kikuchii]|uniref:Cullin family profile domain-containing protein n=1 Tax=Cercospora kikuchii TaxID=84275 RepID=A0A9P3FCY6_9PEZI|nr:uncharacterized protein CKM354_000169900 [Cercospora kikuchii]GIZ38279.1 hypothetical protein CKM354_000169900 [Cercospora kikuchii]
MAAAVAQTGTRGRHDALFDAVFAPKQHTTATPESTPNIGTLASPGAAFGGFNLADDPATQTALFNRQWSTATRFLTLPNGLEGQPRDSRSGPSRQTEHALHYLLSAGATRKQLTQWYSYEISTHFRNFVLPHLQFWDKPVAVNEAARVLSDTVTILQDASKVYFAVGESLDEALNLLLGQFIKQVRHDFHVLMLHSLPRQRVQKTLASYLFQCMANGIETSGQSEQCIDDDVCSCSVDLDLNALSQLEDAGLGGALGERAFAHAVHRLLQGPAVERRCFQVDWHGQTSCVQRLRTWVHDRMLPTLEKAVTTLAGKQTMRLPTQQFVSAAVNTFGRLRTSALFDYVSTWPASQGALLDIKEYLHANGASEKAYLCASFSEQIHRRLFHAGASTTEILGVYINVIHVFRLLDPRGVLLEKVAIPIRNYLRSREDTVSTIAASFLVDTRNTEPSEHDHDKICFAVAEAVNNTQDYGNYEEAGRGGNDLHWLQKNWMPDPIDAGPNWKSSKSDDIVAYIIGLFEPEDFVKAFSTALGQHLLQTKDRRYFKEISVVELLKTRLEPGMLQHAEVMLKDMQESAILNRRLNPGDQEIPPSVPPTPKELQSAIPDDGITLTSLYEHFKNRVDSTQFQATLKMVANKRDDLYYPKRTRLPAERTREMASKEQQNGKTVFETKVLSSHFWPALREGDFRVPQQIAQHKERYEQAFSRTSGQRRLEWRPALDITNIVLDFPDRSVEVEDVEVWKLTVVDAFAEERHNDSDVPPIIYDKNEGLSIARLAEALEMPEDYVQSAVSYWMNKRVLYEKSAGMYAVLDDLEMDVPSIAEPSQLDVEEDVGAIMSEQAVLRQNAPTFQTFIEQMLRNGGAKEIGGMMGITSIMKMVLPTFTYGDDEVKWLLEDMESRGDVVRKGESWAVAK